MSSLFMRRSGALTLVTALLGGGLSAVLPPAQAAAPALGQAAAAAGSHPATDAGARWLTGELTDGLLVGEWGPDHGLTIDAALALDAAGTASSGDTVQQVADAVADTVAAYVSGDAFGDTGSAYAGATAKAAVLALAAGRDPHAFGERDLVASLEDVTTDAGPDAGRVVDRSTYGDYANTLGQSYAVRALHAVDSPEADAATAYLLDQQCAAGFFRLSLAPVDAADRTCDGAADAAPDTDVTALAVLSLLPQADDEDVAPHVSAALDWLERTQRGDGSFGGGVDTEAPNANSTGLAGWALGEAGRTAPAARAAGWVRGLQLARAGSCTAYRTRDLGAIAYDAAGLAAAGAGITDAQRDQVRRATTQALPVLRWAPGRPDSVLVDTAAPPRYHRAGLGASVRVGPVAPGEPVCVSVGKRTRQVHGDHSGLALATVTLPARTASYAVRAQAASGSASPFPARVRALAATRPVVSAPARAVRGRTVRVRVRGLAARESVTLRLRGAVVARGTTNAKGRWTTRLAVTGKPGRAKVTVTGAFPDRRRVVTVRVVRP